MGHNPSSSRSLASGHGVPQVTQEQGHGSGATGHCQGRAAAPSSPWSVAGEWWDKRLLRHQPGSQRDSPSGAASSPGGQPEGLQERQHFAVISFLVSPLVRRHSSSLLRLFTHPGVMWNACACGWGDAGALCPELAPVPLLPSNYRGVSCWQTDPS